MYRMLNTGYRDVRFVLTHNWTFAWTFAGISFVANVFRGQVSRQRGDGSKLEKF